VTTLNERAEHAVLAALLADPAPPLHLYGLAAGDFTDPTHQAVFAALDTIAFTHPDLAPEQRDTLIAEHVGDPEATARALAAWRLQAPDGARTAQYAEYVRAGAIYRDMAAAADRAAAAVAARSGPNDPYLAQHQQLLAQTLGRHAAAYTAVTSGAPDPVEAGSVPPEPSRRAVLEDQVLAGLVAEPDQITVVAAFLTDNAFTSSQRRHVYRTMVTMDYDGDGIDDLTLAWRVELEAAHAEIYGIDVLAPGTTLDEEVYPVIDADYESPATYLERLAVTAVVAETVVHAARDLLVEHLHTVLPDPATLDIDQVTRPDTMHTPGTPTTEITIRPTAPVVAEVEAETEPVRFTNAHVPGPSPYSTTPQPGHLEQDPTITPGVRP